MISFKRLNARSAFVVLSISAVLVSAGCARASHIGAAATVGTTRISTVELEDMVNRGLADPQAAQSLGAQKQDFQRQVLTRLIQGVLVEKLAAREQVTVTTQQVDARRATYAQQAGGDAQLVSQAAQNGVAAADLPTFIRTIVLRDAVGDKLLAGVTVPEEQLRALYQQNMSTFETVHAAHILVKDLATAQMIYAQVTADPTKFTALAKQYSIDTSNKDNGGDLGEAGRGQFVPEFENAIFSATPGTIVGPVKTQFGYHVIHVISHKLTTFDQAKADLTRQALQSQRTDALSKALTDEASRDGVSVSPRYGTWDATQEEVIAAPSALSSPAASPQPAPAGGGLPGGVSSTGP